MYEQEYINLCQRILDEGVWVENERTKSKCLTVTNADFVYTPDDRPLLTIKKSFPVSAAAEMIGYLRGYTNAQDFSDIGTKTWLKNANKTEAWLNNPYRQGENDIGKVYGAVGRDFGGIDLLGKVVKNLSEGIDDRGEILTFWKPDEFDKGCLRPCMYSHHFSLVGGTIHMHSTQRSCDVPLGLNFNSIQCYFLLALICRATGHKQGNVYHKIVNAHIYENQVKQVKSMLKRKPLPYKGQIVIPDWVKTIEDVVDQDLHASHYIDVKNYYHQGVVEFEMTA